MPVEPPEAVASARNERCPVPEAGDYGEAYFEQYTVPYHRDHPHWRGFFDQMAAKLVESVPAATVLDVGCAKGFLVAALVAHGVDARGIDISAHAIADADPQVRDRLSVADLTKPIEGRFDLVTCIEVLEHVAPSDIEVALDNLCAVTDRIAISSTPHGYEEPTHVNVHPPSWWASSFARRGFFHRLDLESSFISPWAAIYERRGYTPADVAYLYESEWAPLHQEVMAKRAGMLDLQRRLDQARADGQVAGEQAGNEAVWVERTMALTDQVLGLQAELAETRYRADLDALRHAIEDSATPEVDRLDEVEMLRSALARETELRQAWQVRAGTLESQLLDARRRTENAEAVLGRLNRSAYWRAARLAARSLRRLKRSSIKP